MKRITLMKRIILLIILFGISHVTNAQIQTGVWRSSNENTDYHHFIRNGGGAAVYINQNSVESDKPILRLSSGTYSPDQKVKFTVENNGSVGIGTLNTGTHKLAVEGTISSGTIFSTTFKSKNTNTDYHHFIRNGGGAAVYVNQSSSESDKPILRLSSGSDKANQGVKFTVENNGYVGIGTTNPDSKLTVKGKIHCEEVLVDLAVPADYVFQKYYTGASELKEDYHMPSLEEVAAYTKENHHLPNVPSATEMQNKGVQLKEMTNLLLQKIEELTLYTIEQEKRIKALEAQIHTSKK